MSFLKSKYLVSNKIIRFYVEKRGYANRAVCIYIHYIHISHNTRLSRNISSIDEGILIYMYIYNKWICLCSSTKHGEFLYKVMSMEKKVL